MKKELFIVEHTVHHFFIKNPSIPRGISRYGGGRYTRNRIEAHKFTDFNEAYKCVENPSFAVIDARTGEKLTFMGS